MVVDTDPSVSSAIETLRREVRETQDTVKKIGDLLAASIKAPAVQQPVEASKKRQEAIERQQRATYWVESTDGIFPPPLPTRTPADDDWIRCFHGEADDVDRFLKDLREWAGKSTHKYSHNLEWRQAGRTVVIINGADGVQFATEWMMGPRKVIDFKKRWREKANTGEADWGSFEKVLRHTFGPKKTKNKT
ncbi:MAG: hypothetical protein Q9160_006385 [Pyrenula sp. 1 TL-2023]